jgi:uncharacterized surface protein with fasciclin (FAS1) repeats
MEHPMKLRLWPTAAFVLALSLAACASAPAPTSIADTAAATPQLSTLSRLVDEAGLTETLKGPGPYTVFAPTDDAFKALPQKTRDALAADKTLLKSVLSYHVVPGKLVAADVKNSNAKTVQGANVALAKAGTFVTIEDAVVTTPDVPATNGVVHIIDRVLMPPK